MKIFVTGASGYIGSAVVAQLARAGHEVSGLVRSDEKARYLRALEATPVVGAMEDTSSWAGAARGAQVIVHCAAEYSARFHELDRATVEAGIEAARAGRGKLFVYTSGVWLYGDTGGGMADENSPLHPPAAVAPRVEVERIVLGSASGGLRTLVLRPGCVYGGRGGMTGSWFESATREGAARIVGDGGNRWTMVHVADLAAAYGTAVESAFGGEIFNLTDRSRFTVRECAEAASHAAGAGGRVVEVPLAEAAKAMGPMAEPVAMDQHVDSSKAARLLGWQPRHGGFVDGVARYYAAWRASQGF